MNIKKLALAAVVGGTAMWLLAGLWHKIIMVQFYTNETEATHEGTGIIFIAYIVRGFLMAYMYSRIRMYKGGRPNV